MNEVLNQWTGDTATIWHALMALCTSFFLSLILAYVYRQTHRGISYSVSLVHTMIIMAITTALIMEIIGSNIARAFSLVGALSIIRFRTAIKEPRDVGFLFGSMAVGMACGTGFFALATLFTLFLSPVVYFLFRFKIGAQPTSEMLLKLQLPEGLDHRTVLQEVFYRFVREHSLLSLETIQGGSALELVYSVHLKPEAKESELMDAVRAVNGNRKVVLLTGAQNVDV
ncbi:MAG: DUF4956 domain-containing protein [Planctomycetes bacterium]|nr:DUF4956 domain-containing protein [Planctomycetota bacterium]